MEWKLVVILLVGLFYSTLGYFLTRRVGITAVLAAVAILPTVYFPFKLLLGINSSHWPQDLMIIFGFTLVGSSIINGILHWVRKKLSARRQPPAEPIE